MKNQFVFLAGVLFLNIIVLFSSSCQKDNTASGPGNILYDSLIVGTWMFESDSGFIIGTNELDRVYGSLPDSRMIFKKDGSGSYNDGFGTEGVNYTFNYYISKTNQLFTKRNNNSSYDAGEDIFMLTGEIMKLKTSSSGYYITSNSKKGYSITTWRRIKF